MIFGFKESIPQDSDFDFLKDLAPKLTVDSTVDEVEIGRASCRERVSSPV